MALREDERVIVGGDTSKARAELGILGKGVNRTKGQFDRFGRRVTDLDKRSKGLIGRFNRLATAANGMRAAAAGAIFYGIGRIGGMFIGFDDKLRQAAAAMGATAKEFDNLKSKALEVSQATRFTARETAEALLRLGQAGLSVEESLEALPHTINLAAAGALEVGRATEIMTDSLAAMGLATSDSQRVADLLAKASVSTATSVDQMGIALARAAPHARTLGVSIEELVLELSILAKQGIKAELSATRIRSLVNQLTDKKIVADLKEQNIIVYDSAGSFVGLRQVVEQFRVALQGLTDEEGADLLDLLGNVRAKGAVKTLSGLDPEVVERIAAALRDSNDAARIQAKIMESGLGGAWRRFISSVEALIVRLIDSLAPALITIIDLFTAGIQLIGKLKPIFDALGFAIWGVAQAIKGADWLISVALAAIVKPIVMLAEAIDKVVRKIPGFKQAMSWLDKWFKGGAFPDSDSGGATQKSFAEQKVEEATRLWDAHQRLAAAKKTETLQPVYDEETGAISHIAPAGSYEAVDEFGRKKLYTAAGRQAELDSLYKRALSAGQMSRLSDTGDAYSYAHESRGTKEPEKELSEKDRERALEKFADFSTRLADQAAKAEADRVAKIRSIEAIADAERLLIAQANIERDRALAEEKQAYDLALAAAKAEQIEEIERRHKENLANLEIAHNERIAGIQSKAAKDAAKLAQDKIATTQALLGGVSSLLSVFGQQSDKAFKAWKAVAIAEAIVATYLAVDKALASGLGPPWSYFAAAAALAFGMANVARIKATKRDSGASSTAAAASAPASSAGAVVTPATTGTIYAGRLDAVPGAARLERFTQGESLEAERQHTGDLKAIRVSLDAKVGGQPLAVFVARQEVQSDNS